LKFIFSDGVLAKVTSLKQIFSEDKKVLTIVKSEKRVFATLFLNINFLERLYSDIEIRALKVCF